MSYQAVYDATRAAFDISNLIPFASEAIGCIRNEMTRPSVLFRPRLTLDGSAWHAMYGDNLVTGVSGFGSTPEEAMRDFDKHWSKQ